MNLVTEFFFLADQLQFEFFSIRPSSEFHPKRCQKKLITAAMTAETVLLPPLLVKNSTIFSIISDVMCIHMQIFTKIVEQIIFWHKMSNRVVKCNISSANLNIFKINFEIQKNAFFWSYLAFFRFQS